MSDIFFSYSSVERDRVAPIVAALEAEGWSVFWDRKTPVGVTWSQYIRENLEQAQCIVVAWSRQSIDSHWVESEAGEGRDRGCLVPLKLDDVTPPFGFKHIQAADFTGWVADSKALEWRDLVTAIERHLPRHAEPSPDESKPSDPDISNYWQRLLAKPTIEELHQLADEVTALRQQDPASPELIKLQRSATEAIDKAKGPVADKPAGAGRGIWPWAVGAFMSVILGAAVVIYPINGDSPLEPSQTSMTELRENNPDQPAASRATGNGQSSQASIPVPELVDIPAGCFEMGSPAGVGQDDERPQHRVCLKAFQMGRYEVTFDEYDAYARAKSLTPPGDSGWGRGRRPVINVNWNDAQGYVDWLTGQLGRECRLPSEAEWEYAARAGATRRYALPAPHGSDDITGRGLANCDGCGSEWDNKRTAPVGRFPANAWGLHDMHGNLWEWVQDHYHDNYPGAPDDGSAREDRGSDAPRVLRGGAWVADPEDARSAYRLRLNPGYRDYYWGFRVVCASPILR
ncbi:MAG: SUMF1/EgtB/PvdO family nonheme iron enzyme [Candidatus Thiodiazotropha taylori]